MDMIILAALWLFFLWPRILEVNFLSRLGEKHVPHSCRVIYIVKYASFGKLRGVLLLRQP